MANKKQEAWWLKWMHNKNKTLRLSPNSRRCKLMSMKITVKRGQTYQLSLIPKKMGVVNKKIIHIYLILTNKLRKIRKKILLILSSIKWVAKMNKKRLILMIQENLKILKIQWVKKKRLFNQMIKSLTKLKI